MLPVSEFDSRSTGRSRTKPNQGIHGNKKNKNRKRPNHGIHGTRRTRTGRSRTTEYTEQEEQEEQEEIGSSELQLASPRSMSYYYGSEFRQNDSSREAVSFCLFIL
jgi:hypothetical protein